jgi:hypothetical protein
MKNKLGMFAMLIVGLIFGVYISATSHTVFAAKPVTIVPQDAKLVINGQNTAERPIVVNGTSYLPVRAIADALHFDVKWDQESATITITDKVTEPVNDQEESDSEW